MAEKEAAAEPLTLLTLLHFHSKLAFLMSSLPARPNRSRVQEQPKNRLIGIPSAVWKQIECLK